MNSSSIWIVGAGCGIGLGIAKSFGKRGYAPVLITKDEDNLQHMKQALLEHNIEAAGIVAYSGDVKGLTAALTELLEAHGTPEVLVYNASAHTPGYPSEVSTEDMLQDFQVNVLGAAASVQALLPKMKEQGKGSILLTGGGQALHPTATLASLGIGKSGLRSLALSLHDELKPHGLYAGTLTVCGFVQEGTPFDSKSIGDAFYKMHSEKKEAEVQLKP